MIDQHALVQSIQTTGILWTLTCVLYLLWLSWKPMGQSLEEVMVQIIKLSNWDSVARVGLTASLIAACLSPWGSTLQGITALLAGSSGVVIAGTIAKRKLAILRAAKDNTMRKSSYIQLTISKGNIPLEIWFRPTANDWPPIKMEIAIGDVVVDAQDAAPNLQELVCKELENKVNLEEVLKQTTSALRQKGATHLIDIQGAEMIEPIRKWLEKHMSNLA